MIELRPLKKYTAACGKYRPRASQHAWWLSFEMGIDMRRAKAKAGKEGEDEEETEEGEEEESMNPRGTVASKRGPNPTG